MGMSSIIRAALLFGLAFMVAYLIITRELSYFINPRFQYLSIFSLIFLLILGCVQINHYKRPSAHRIGTWGYLIVLLPICAFLLFPSKPLDASIADQKVYTYVPTEKPKNQSTNQQQLAQEDDSWEEPYKQKASELEKLSVITLSSKNYLEVTNVLMMYPEKFVGKKITSTGFVYREEGLKDNQFVLARLSMACCVADAGVVGFLIDTPLSNQFKKDQWYEIEGTFEITKNETGEVPGIKLKSYKRVPALKDSYVYQQF
jgi:putative membrane protein